MSQDVCVENVVVMTVSMRMHAATAIVELKMENDFTRAVEYASFKSKPFWQRVIMWHKISEVEDTAPETV